MEITPPTATVKVSNIQIITPCQPMNPASVTMNEGSRRRVMSVPRMRPITVVAPTPGQDGQPPGKVVRGRYQSGHQAGTDAGDEDHGQVDLAEQKDEDLADGEHA